MNNSIHHLEYDKIEAAFTYWTDDQVELYLSMCEEYDRQLGEVIANESSNY